MAFQIKKDLHLNTGIYLKLLSDPTTAKVEKDMFDKERYTLPVEMVGHDITDGSGVKWFQNDKGDRLSAAAAPTVKTEIAVAAVSMFLKDIRLPPKIKL